MTNVAVSTLYRSTATILMEKRRKALAILVGAWQESCLLFATFVHLNTIAGFLRMKKGRASALPARLRSTLFPLLLCIPRAHREVSPFFYFVVVVTLGFVSRAVTSRGLDVGLERLGMERFGRTQDLEKRGSAPIEKICKRCACHGARCSGRESDLEIMESFRARIYKKYEERIIFSLFRHKAVIN